MRILHVHNFYQQPGGEDQAFLTENALVESRGHRLTRFSVRNDDITGAGRAARTAATAIWNPAVYRQLRAIIRRDRPEVVGFQNTFPLISPAAYSAARAEGAAVVQTLQNYRLVCANAYLFRDGRTCEECLTRALPWPAVLHACYRGSRPASAAVTAMLAIHRALGTWTDKVDVYVALSEFARRKLAESGLPADRIVVKPHFVEPDPGAGRGAGGYAMFAGRLSDEKGLDTLVAAWARLGGRMPLRIVGDGRLAPLVSNAAATIPGIEWLGRRTVGEVNAMMGEASVLLVPSKWYEPFGRVVIEAFAKGTPVIASRTGGLAELVEPGRTGLLHLPGSADDLASQVAWTLDHPRRLTEMRTEARREYERKYTAARNYDLLMNVYRRALAARGRWPEPVTDARVEDGQ